MRRLFRACIPVVVLSLVSLGGIAQERSSELDRRAYEMYQQVFSPFCPGRSLNDCPSSKAQDLKLEMRQRLERGDSVEVILDDVFRRFGDTFRAVPRYSGFGKLVWWIPLGFLALGGLVIMVALRGRRSSAVAKTNENIAQSVPSDLQARIQRELDEFQG